MGIHTYKIKSNLRSIFKLFIKLESLSSKNESIILSREEFEKLKSSMYEIVNEVNSILGEDLYHE